MEEIFFKMVHEKVPSSYEDLLSIIRERWNYLNEKYCFSEIHTWKN